MKVIAKKFRGVWHYGVITSVVYRVGCWRSTAGRPSGSLFSEDGDIVDLLRSERGAKARRPGQRGAKARRPGQRGAKARGGRGMRGAKARRPGQRRRPGQARRQGAAAGGSVTPRPRLPGQKWAASLVVSRVRAAGIEEDEKDMRKRVTRFVRERRKAHLNAKLSTVPAAQLVGADT
eukprot:jgi/Tetstr1/449156/TSEL_003802.t1